MFIRDRGSTGPETARAVSKAAPAASSPGLNFAAWLEEASATAGAAPALTELSALTRGRWLAAEPPPPGLPVFELQGLSRMGATLVLDNDSAWGCVSAPVPACQRVTLRPEETARLRQVLPMLRR